MGTYPTLRENIQTSDLEERGGVMDELALYSGTSVIEPHWQFDMFTARGQSSALFVHT